jgi:quercetin dioxygenase-like cupin family protein
MGRRCAVYEEAMTPDDGCSKDLSEEFMTLAYTLLTDLTERVDVPADGTLSTTIYQDERLKVVLFAFAVEQEMSEHTAAVPAIMHFLKGESEITLGSDSVVAKAGTWVHMPANLPHSIRANTPTVMLLLLLKGSTA